MDTLVSAPVSRAGGTARLPCMLWRWVLVMGILIANTRVLHL